MMFNLIGINPQARSDQSRLVTVSGLAVSGWQFIAVMVVTWLILPVVICLSQRLSHACLSISNLYSETANGSLNQLSFI
jgi:hypothetical protein